MRHDSPIIGLKNFNNWIKSVLFANFCHPALASSPIVQRPRSGAKKTPITRGKVLDMGCGKGGDLNKWAKAHISEYVGLGESLSYLRPVLKVTCKTHLPTDVASVSIDQARQRYEGFRGPRFEATFAACDCYSVSISTALDPAKLSTPFDVVSMQFCMHYAFETEERARCMLDNVSRWLRPGGVFVGTIPNAGQLLCGCLIIQTQPSFLTSTIIGTDPGYGTPLTIHLATTFTASAPTFQFPPTTNSQSLVFVTCSGSRTPWRTCLSSSYFGTISSGKSSTTLFQSKLIFSRLAEEYQLVLKYRREFHDMFTEFSEHSEFGPLMTRMQVIDARGDSKMDEEQWEAASEFSLVCHIYQADIPPRHLHWVYL